MWLGVRGDALRLFVIVAFPAPTGSGGAYNRKGRGFC